MSVWFCVTGSLQSQVSVMPIFPLSVLFPFGPHRKVSPTPSLTEAHHHHIQ
jgi:hypothetical protein